MNNEIRPRRSVTSSFQLQISGKRIFTSLFSDNLVNSVEEGAISDGEGECTVPHCTEIFSNTNATKSTELAHWATTNAISQTALGKLLNLLRNWLPHEDFLKDPRTLLKTPRNISTSEKCGGQYYYFGIIGHLEATLRQGIVEFKQTLPKLQGKANMLTLKLGIDGVPLSRSSNLQFWPILLSVDQGKHKKVHVVCLFYGQHKPTSIEDFLEDFVHEMKLIEDTGVTDDVGVKFEVRIRCIMADAPARSFLKCVKNHNAYYGCERCSRKGKWRQRVVYPVREDSDLHTTNFRITNML